MGKEAEERDMAVSAAINYHFAQFGLSQSDFANKINVGKPILCQLLSGKKPYGLKIHTKVAKSLGYENVYDFYEFGRKCLQEGEKSIGQEIKNGLSVIQCHRPYQQCQKTKHEKLVSRFKDQERMLKINEMLLDLENADPAKISTIEETIKAFHAGIKKKPKKKANNHD